MKSKSLNLHLLVLVNHKAKITYGEILNLEISCIWICLIKFKTRSREPLYKRIHNSHRTGGCVSHRANLGEVVMIKFRACRELNPGCLDCSIYTIFTEFLQIYKGLISFVLRPWHFHVKILQIHLYRSKLLIILREN